MTDYERGVEQASSIYKEVIREYVSENEELRELVRVLWKVFKDTGEGEDPCMKCEWIERCVESGWDECEFDKRMRELGGGVDG